MGLVRIAWVSLVAIATFSGCGNEDDDDSTGAQSGGRKSASGGAAGETASGGSAGETTRGSGAGETGNVGAAGEGTRGSAAGETASGGSTSETASGGSTGKTASGGSTGEIANGGSIGETARGGSGTTGGNSENTGNTGGTASLGGQTGSLPEGGKSTAGGALGTAGSANSGGTSASAGGGPFGEGGTGVGGAGGRAGDGIAPTASIAFPPRLSYTDATALTIRGHARAKGAVQSVVVNGVTASTTDDFASWAAQVPIADGDNQIVVSVTDSDDATNAQADAVLVRNKGSLLSGYFDFQEDRARGRLVVNDPNNGFMVVDSTTRRVSRLFDSGPGANVRLRPGVNWVIDQARGKLISCDCAKEDRIWEMDLQTGQVSTLSPATASNNPIYWGGPICIDSLGDRAFSYYRGLVEIDLKTGTRRTVTDQNDPDFGAAADIVYDDVTEPTAPRVLIAGPFRIDAIDVNTGARSTLITLSTSATTPPWKTKLLLDAPRRRLVVLFLETSDSGAIAETPLTFDLSGGDSRPLDLSSVPLEPSPHLQAAAQRADGSLLLSSRRGDFFALSLETSGTSQGSQFAGAPVGSGPVVGAWCGLAVTHELGSAPRIKVCDQERKAILDVDLATGARTTLAANTAPGYEESKPVDMVLIPNAPPWNRPMLFVGIHFLGAHLPAEGVLLAVDPAGGARSIVSGHGTGSGPDFLSIDAVGWNAVSNQLLVAGAVTAEPPSQPIGIAGFWSVDDQGKRNLIASTQRGSGPSFGGVFERIVHDPRNSSSSTSAFVTSGSSLLKLDLTTGDRSPLLNLPSTFRSIAFDQPGQRLIAIASKEQSGMIAVDPDSGQSTLLSETFQSSSRGSGPSLFLRNPWAEFLQVDPIDPIAYVTGGVSYSLFAVDLISGDRVVVAH